MSTENIAARVERLSLTGSWKEALSIAKEFDASTDPDVTDELIIEAYESALELGLNIQNDREEFIEANKVLAKHYIRYERYGDAQRSLLMLDVYLVEKPDWIHLYMANMMIHTSLEIWAENPADLFSELDAIDPTNTDSIESRTSIFKNFLFLIETCTEKNFHNKVASKRILEKAAKYSLFRSVEVEKFRKAVCPSLDISAFLPAVVLTIEDKETRKEETSIPITETSEYEDLLNKFNKNSEKSEQRQSELDKDRQEINALRASIQQKDTEIRSMCEKTISDGKDTAKYQALLEKKELERSTLSIELDRIHAKIEELQKTIALSEKEKAEMRRQISILEDDLKRSARAGVNSVKTDDVSETSEYKELLRKLEQASKENDAQKSEINKAHREIEALKASVQQKAFEIRSIQAGSLSDSSDAEKYRELLESKEQERSRTASELNTVQKRLDSLQLSLHFAEQENVKIRRQMSAFEEASKQQPSDRKLPIEFETLGYVLGSLQMIRQPLAEWLRSELMELPGEKNTWYRRYVELPISEKRDTNDWMVKKVKDCTSLLDLDAYTILKVAQKNMDNIFPCNSPEKREKRQLINDILDVRNEISHLDGRTYSKEEVIEMLEIIKYFFDEFTTQREPIQTIEGYIKKVKTYKFESRIDFAIIPMS